MIHTIIHNNLGAATMGTDAYFATDLELSIPERVQSYFQSVARSDDYRGFETAPLRQVGYITHSEAARQITYLITVPQSLCNKDGNLHGGAATTLLDNLSSTALFTVAKPGFWENMGVSRSLYAVFHRAVPCGSVVKVVASVTAAGGRMASLRAEMRMDDDDALCVTCIHEKVGIMNSRL